MSCKNISPFEQVARVIVAALLLGFIIFMKPDVVISAVAALVTLLLMYTALIEYCPLKDWLGLHKCKAVAVKGQTTKGKRTAKKGKTTTPTKKRKTTKKTTTKKAAKRSKRTTKKTTKKTTRKRTAKKKGRKK